MGVALRGALVAALVLGPLALSLLGAPDGIATLGVARADDVPPIPPVPPVPPPPSVPPVPPAPPVPEIPPVPPVPEVPLIPSAPPVPDAPPATPDASAVPPPPVPGASAVPPPPTATSLPVAPSTAASLDELLAAVEGEYITRRMLVRQIGKREADDDEVAYEKRVHSRLLQRVVTRILVKAAERFGLDAKPDVVDKEVEQSSRREVEDAKERAERAEAGSGAGITFAKLLADRGQTLEEYKKDLANDILVGNYFQILIRGVPGKRPQFDPEPSPGDALRLYGRHPGAFDVKAGVRIGIFMLYPLDLLDDGKRDYDQAIAEAKTRMGALLAQFVAGAKPAALAKSYAVAAGRWRVTAPGEFEEKQAGGQTRPFDAWAFDPARRAGETTILEGNGGVILGVAILETRGGRAKTFDEVCPDILKLIKGVRLQRFQSAHTLELLRIASVVPRSLIDEIEASTRDRLKRLDDDPVARDIRMR